MNNNVTASLEDYLEAIYKIIEEKQGVRAIDISKRLGVRRSSVTEALKNLAEKKLVNYGRYDVISLTDTGIEIAKNVILKHQVLFDFFTRILGVTKDEAQENACRVEHVITEDVLQRLIAFVEFNKHIHIDESTYINEFQKFYQNLPK